MPPGRPSSYKSEYANVDRINFDWSSTLLRLGATDSEVKATYDAGYGIDDYVVLCAALIRKDRLGINAAHKEKRRAYKAGLRKLTAYKIEAATRARMWHAIKDAGRKASITGLPYSVKELMDHLERLFKDGMNWSNYGKDGWHIDHVRPCASFDMTDDCQFQECWELSNLQPLWAKDNLKKGSKYG